jgi:two-component system response regulator PhcR
MPIPDPLYEARAILYVDDEPASCKWFSRMFGDEFTIATATSANEALALLGERGHEFAVLMTDYRMPEHDGVKLLQAVQRDFRHLVRLLATAYAGKDMAIAAINQGKVLRILEKPLDDVLTREALREALTLHRTKAIERALNEGRVTALRETLGFLAHELNTPLATVRGYLSAMRSRHEAAPPGAPEGTVQFVEDRPGEIMAALASAERRALYCQSLVSTFVQSARDAYPGAAAQTISAASLVGALMDEFPFEDNERLWVSSRILEDFHLPGRRDLLYLVLCTLTKNALQAMRGRVPVPSLRIDVGREPRDAGPAQPFIRFVDSGPGIVPDLLARLTREPITTRSASGGNGMGLVFCRRVMQSIDGSIDIQSEIGRGTTVSLGFQPFDSQRPVRPST